MAKEKPPPLTPAERVAAFRARQRKKNLCACGKKRKRGRKSCPSCIAAAAARVVASRATRTIPPTTSEEGSSET
jgi:hypothetical protein